jgi:hypothetical protein
MPSLDDIFRAQPGLASSNPQTNQVAGLGTINNPAVAVPAIASVSSPNVDANGIKVPDDPDLAKKKRQKAIYQSVLQKQTEISDHMNQLRRIYTANGKEFEKSEDHTKLFKEWNELNGILKTLPKDVATFPDPDIVNN